MIRTAAAVFALTCLTAPFSLAQTAGSLDVHGELGEAARIDRLKLEAAGLSATGTVQARADGGLDRASFSSVRIGSWLDAPVDLVGRAEAWRLSLFDLGEQMMIIEQSLSRFVFFLSALLPPLGTRT